MNNLDNLAAVLEQQAQAFNDKAIYHYLNENGDIYRSLSFNEIVSVAKNNAEMLHANYPDQKTAILLFPQGPSFILAYFSCVFAGIVVIPLPCTAESIKNEVFLNQITLIQQQTGDTLMLADTSVENTIRDSFGSMFNVTTIDPHNNAYIDFQYIANNIACYLFTSGSTSQPKGVVLSHSNLIHNSTSFTTHYGYNEATVTVSWLPHFHAFGMLLNFYYPLVSGTPVYIMPTASFVNRPLTWLDNASKYSATHIAAPDFAFRLCALEVENGNTSDWNLHRLEYVFSSSEPVQVESFERFFNAFESYGLKKGVLSAMYGMSEASVISTENKRALVTGNIHKEDLENGIVTHLDPSDTSGRVVVSCGQAIPDTRILCVQAQTTHVCSSNEIGEVWITGPAVFNGYLLEKDNEDIWGILWNDGIEERYLKTGDAGFISDGNLFITGRIKEMIVINGKKYYPVDIEHTVTSCFELLLDTRKAVFSETVSDREQVSLVLEYPFDYSVETLDALSAEIAARVMERNGIQVTNIIYTTNHSIPRTATGKIQRKKCQQLINHDQLYILHRSTFDASDSSAADSFTEEEKDIHSTLIRLFKDVIGKPVTLDHSTSFFSIGVGSVELMRVVTRINNQFNLSIEAGDILSNSSIAKLTSVIRLKSADSVERIEPGAVQTAYAEKHYPLTENQRGVWFELLSKRDSYQYNTPMAFYLKHNIDIKKLEEAFLKLQAQYPVLRSRIFECNDGTPVLQIVDTTVALNVVYSNADAASIQRRLHKKSKEAIIPDRSKALLYGELIRSGEETFLFINGSHLILDGFSCQLLMDQLLKNYQDASEPFHTDLSYLDFNVWEKKALLNQEKKALKYLFNKQEHLFEGLNLPFDNTTVKEQTHLEHFYYEINNIAQKRIDACVEKLNTTKTPFFIAIYSIALYRFTRQQHITIGTALLNRPDEAYESSIGYFANVLPLQVALQNDQSFDTLVKQLMDEILHMISFQSYPLPAMLQQLPAGTIKSGEPVFQVLFLYQKMKDLETQENSIIKKQILTVTQATIGDITLDISDFTDRSVIYLKYNSDKFNAETMELFFNNFLDLLEKSLTDTSHTVADLKRISANDRLKIEEWNRNEINFPVSTNLYTYFQESAQNFPFKTAITNPAGEQFTYTQLSERVDALCAVLFDNKITASSNVSVFLERSEWLPISILAIIKIGATYIPLDTGLPLNRLQYICDDVQADAVIQISSVPLQLNDVAITRINLDTCFSTENTHTGSYTHAYSPEDTVFVIYTSGSTGNPKGVDINHKSVTNFYHSMLTVPGFSASDHLLAVSTISFDIAFTEIVLPLLLGASITIVSGEDQRNGETILEKLQQHAITVMQCTPVTWKLLIEAGWRGGTTLRKALSTGEALTHTLAQKILENQVELWNMYGPSEGTIETTVASVRDYKHVTLGLPLPNVQLFVLDENLHQVPIGAYGELYIGGINLANGYRNKPDLTHERFIQAPHEIVTSTSRLYKTGDIVRQHANGEYSYYGRNDYQVKIRGYRIELNEIEYILKQYKDIEEACVLVEEENEVYKIKACVVPVHVSSGSIQYTELVQFLKTRLPSYMLPHSFYVRDKLPVSSNGKINRNTLFENGYELETQHSVGEKNERVTETAVSGNQIKDAWEKVLGRQVFDLNSNFFDSGGDSVLIVQLKQALASLYPSKIIKVTDLFKYTNIREQSKWLNEKAAADQKNTLAVTVNKKGMDLPGGYQAIFEDALMNNEN
jgi:polyketide synthase PksJ